MQENNTSSQKSNGNGMETDQLIQRLKKEDTKHLMTFKRFMWILIVFVVFYSILFIFNPLEEWQWIYRLSGVCYVTAFIILGLLFRKYYRKYKFIDYSLPVAEMLKQAAERYSFKGRNSWIVIFPLLLIDAGITISYFQRLTDFAPWTRIGLVQAVYLPILFIAFVAGVLIWYKRQKPLKDAALKLLDDLQN